MNVGCDIDGVLAAGFVPEEENYVIVSGRMVYEWERTIALLGTKRPIYLRPWGGDGNVIAAGEWKSFIVKSLQLVKFYEDDPTQAHIIRTNNPQCTVVSVINGILQ